MGLLSKEESYAIMGACSEAYQEKGCRFLEAVCQECLEIAFGLRQIEARLQPRLELKAASALKDEHRAQVQNQLRANGHQLGLLVNFGHDPQLDYERIVL